MANEVYSFEILAELTKARQSVDNFSRQTQSQLSSLNLTSAVTAISTGFLAISSVAESAFNVINSAIGSSIEQALEAEKAQVSLANALRITGEFSQSAVDGFNDFAVALQKTTTLTDDQIISAAALAKQYKLTNEETKKVIAVSAGLAARTGVDLDTAVQKLGQSFNGVLDKSLVKVVPGLKSLSKESLIAGGALGLIENQVKGSAAALADTFGGALIKTQNSFNKIKETFGSFFTDNEALKQIIKEINISFDIFQKSLEENGDSLRKLITDGFVLLIQSIPLVIQGVATIDSIFNDLTATIKDLLIITTKLPTALLQAATGSTEAFEDLKSSLLGVTDAVRAQERQKNIYEPLVKGAQDLASRVEAAGKIQNKLTESVQKTGVALTGIGVRGEILSEEKIKRQVELLERARKSAEELTKQPFSLGINSLLTTKIVLTDNEGNVIKESLKPRIDLTTVQKDLAAAGFGLIASITRGAAGAKDLVAGVLGNVADAIVPGIGGAAQQIVGVLSQGPEQVKKTIQEFSAAIPSIIENIIASLPVLIEELAKAIPRIIDAIAERSDEIVAGLVKAMPSVGAALAAEMPKISVAFTVGLIENIPEIVTAFANEFLKIPQRFVEALLDALPGGGIADAITGGGEENGGLFGGGGFLGLGFAEGGRVPSDPAFEGDRFPARLNAGEQVFDKDLTSQLEEFLSQQEGGGRPIQLTQIIQVGEAELARVILNLNRNGFRTS